MKNSSIKLNKSIKTIIRWHKPCKALWKRKFWVLSVINSLFTSPEVAAIKNGLENIVVHDCWHAGLNYLQAKISAVYHQRVATSTSLLLFLLLGLEGRHMLQCWTVFTSCLHVFLSAGLPTAREWLVLSFSHSSPPSFPPWPSSFSFYPPRCVSDWILSAS